MTQVIIPTAGLGSRLGTLTANINKALIPVGIKPAISYIIDWYPSDYKFIIALGYNGGYIKDFISLVYPKRDFVFVNVDPYEGPGSGLGYTLKCCKSHIKEDFFFHSNDGIILDQIDFKNIITDTIFLSSNKVNSLKYRTVKINKTSVVKLVDKTTKKIPNLYNYIGVAYIKDFKDFKKFLSKISFSLGESDYFINKLKNKKKINNFFIDHWYDVGDIDDLKRARKDISDFDNLPKEDEFIYFIDNQVIKFFINPELSKKRVQRAKKLKNFVPKIKRSSKNFYVYDYIEGQLLSTKIDLYKSLNEFLKNCNKEFWIKKKLTAKNKKKFHDVCLNFYYHKTIDRINSFYQTHEISDNEEIINNFKSPKLKNLLNQIDWNVLCDGMASRIHGDFHFENILLNKKGKYKFIDWRQDFGGLIDYGDVYYDLAKLKHGIIVDHDAIRNNMFEIKISKSKNIVDFELYRKQKSYECEKIFDSFVEKNKFSLNKVNILTSLIYLNIATLHHQPYSLFLYYLGKDMLNKVLNEK